MVQPGEAEPLYWDEMQEQVVEESLHLPRESSLEAQNAEKRSQSVYLLRALLDEAERMAREKGISPNSDAAWSIFGRAANVAKEISFSRILNALPYSSEERARVTEAQAREAFRVTHSTGANFLVEEARKGKKMYTDKGSLEASVGTYLQHSFRPMLVDRLLLVALIDLEVTAYLAEVYQRNMLTGKSVASVMKRAPVVTWIIGRAWAVLRLAVVIAVLLWATREAWISEEMGFGIGLGAIGFFLLGTVVSFFGYLSFRQRWRSLGPKLVDLPAQMVNFYAELHSEGPLSVRRVREQAQKLADLGAVWPGAFWALLEDIESRKISTLT